MKLTFFEKLFGHGHQFNPIKHISTLIFSPFLKFSFITPGASFRPRPDLNVLNIPKCEGFMQIRWWYSIEFFSSQNWRFMYPLESLTHLCAAEEWKRCRWRVVYHKNSRPWNEMPIFATWLTTLTWNNSLNIIQISYNFTPFDSCWDVLFQVFWVEFDWRKRLTVKSTAKCGIATRWRSVFARLRPNALTDWHASKTKVVERFKNYTLVASLLSCWHKMYRILVSFWQQVPKIRERRVSQCGFCRFGSQFIKDTNESDDDRWKFESCPACDR